MTPVSKPRMTQRDKWLDPPRPCVARYRAYADRVRAVAGVSHFDMPEAGAAICFHIPMPKSWSKSRRAAKRGTPHRQKPDLDNLVKAVFDALLGEDCTIWHLASVEKRWADMGEFTISHGAPEA